MHYVPPNMNLESFVKAFHPNPPERAKGWWCYEYIDDFKRLEERGPPPIEAFKSTLKCTEMSPEEYAEFRAWWDEKGFVTLRDMLREYNNMDVGPFLEAINNMFEIFKELGVDIFKEAISLPGVAQKRMFSKQQKEEIVALFDKYNSHWHDLFKVRSLLMETRNRKIKGSFITLGGIL
jgi:hypothetical protein